MKIAPVNNTNFKMNYKLSNETLITISKTTRLSVDELFNLPIDKAALLMRERGAIKEPSRFQQWLLDIYKSFGEKTGLLNKQYNIYIDVD